jgi:hypothetical protein
MAFFGLNRPSNQKFLREIAEWTAAQKKKEQKEAEEQREIAIAAQIQKAQSQYMNLSNQRYSTYGISRSSADDSLSGYASWPSGLLDLSTGQLPAGQFEATTSIDPHKMLTEKISKLSAAEPAKLSGRRSPDYTATLTGWRGWTIKDEKLQALGMTKAWKPKKAEPAKCQTCKSHRAPSRECSCGYWSFKSMDVLTKALVGYVGTVLVVGSVEIWGRVIECENGYRSEYAYPKELWLLKPDMEYLSWEYGVPVRTLQEDEEKREQK